MYNREFNIFTNNQAKIVICYGNALGNRGTTVLLPYTYSSTVNYTIIVSEDNNSDGYYFTASYSKTVSSFRLNIKTASGSNISSNKTTGFLTIGY